MSNLRLLPLLALTLAPAATLAATLRPVSGVELEVHYLLQTQATLGNDPDAGQGLEPDFFIRRSRIILKGRASRWISFFMETDQPNWGKGGDWQDVPFFVQDAFFSANLHRALIIDAGMLLVPFVHQARQGAANLLTLDYHSALIRYPAGSHKVWRDGGVEVRGLVGPLDYRVALTRGVGASDRPRVSGRLAYNLLDPEEGFFLGGTYLGAKRVLSLGLAADGQQDAFGDDRHYLALGADLFVDLPLGRRRLSGQIDVVSYRGDENVDGGAGGWARTNAGTGLLLDLGLAFGPLEPLLALDWFRPRGAAALRDQLLGLHAGLSWWVQGHTFNIKLDLGLVKPEGQERAAPTLLLQAQLFV